LAGHAIPVHFICVQFLTEPANPFRHNLQGNEGDPVNAEYPLIRTRANRYGAIAGKDRFFGDEEFPHAFE
jgi:hypothetical protein